MSKRAFKRKHQTSTFFAQFDDCKIKLVRLFCASDVKSSDLFMTSIKLVIT